MNAKMNALKSRLFPYVVSSAGIHNNYDHTSYPDLATSDSTTSPLDVRKFYEGKTLFCTGCTGFLGKVVVEKFLRDIPNVKKLYLLVREKKEKNGKVIPANVRLMKEILRSPIMDRIIAEKFGGNRENFEKFALTKIEGVFGDVTEENIFSGTPNEMVEQLKEEVEIIIHSAATIGFTERLDFAINLNSFGTLRCLNFAKQCKNMLCFAYISTAYTNSNLKSGSRVDEKFYPFRLPGNEEIEVFCERLRKMEAKEIEKTTNKLLAFTKYPNTYTVTKRMAEALLCKYKGDVPVAIIRPTIVGAALKEPVPAWIDAVSGSGAVSLFVGLGVISLLPGDPNNVSDQVPVDHVANAMIVCPADVATTKTKLKVYHVGTSTSNPTKWADTVSGVVKYWHTHQPEKSIARAEYNMIPSPLMYHTQFMVRYTWMINLYTVLGALLRKKSVFKVVEGLKKMAERQEMLTSSFRHFTMNEWFFEIDNLENAYNRLRGEERDIFTLDLSVINWGTYYHYFCYGLHKYILKENPIPPTTTDLIKSNEYNFNFFNDIELAFSAGGQFKEGFTREQVKQMVLHSKGVQLEIKKEAESKKLSISQVEKRALDIMDKMFANPNNNAIRAFGWILRKIWRRMYQSIIVDSNELEKLKELAKKSSTGTLVFIPTHRSYIDFLIVSYVFFVYGAPVPHIAAGEDFLNMFLVRDLFRYSGAFFMRRSFGNDNLYKSIFSEYVHRLLMDGNPIEFFVEGTRSRAGKTLRPKLGLLKTIADAYLENRVENLTLVPIHIGYERVIESESHSRELLGGNKKGESLTNLVKASSVLFNKYGDVNVKIAEPISLKDYIQELKNDHSRLETSSTFSSSSSHSSTTISSSSHSSTTIGKSENIEKVENIQNCNLSSSSFDPFYNENDKEFLIKRLGSKIAFALNESAVIMPTAIVGTVLLSYRDGISLDELKSKSEWLKNQILSRSGRVHWNEQQSTTSVVTKALNLIGHLISKRKNMIEPAIEVKSDNKKILELSYYRNQLVHLFFKEGVIGCALFSFGQKQMLDSGISLTDLFKKCDFLTDLLSLEFMYKENPEEPEKYMETLESMAKRGIISLRDNSHVLVSAVYLENLKFICSLLWPVIEGYWGTSMSLLSMPLSGSDHDDNIATVNKQALHERIQWLIEKFYFDDKVQFYEACSMETIRNAISIFNKWNVLQTSVVTIPNNDSSRKKGSKKAADQVKTEEVVSLLPPYTEIPKLLEFVGEIQQFRKMAVKSDKAVLTEIPLRHSRL